MDILDELYKEILQPETFITYFKDDAEFEEWVRTGEIIDIHEALKVFQEFELYEHCAILKKVLDEKIDTINLSDAI
jgi:ABC-type histidine transport system ATPase subunit